MARRIVGIAILVIAVGYLVHVADAEVLLEVGRALVADPIGLALALVCYATAFALRAGAWTAVLRGLSPGQSWAALHVALLGNHVLPFRLGEVLRVTSVLRRTGLAVRPVAASATAMRVADLLAVLVLALACGPGLLLGLAGPWVWAAVAALALAGAGGMVWLRRLPRKRVRLPGLGVAAAAMTAWVLESTVVWQVAHVAEVPLTPFEAVAVTAATIAAQTVAVTPGGVGSYEAAATAALVGFGAPPGEAFAVALATHAVKTAYALVIGIIALIFPEPSYWGRLRLPRGLPARPEPWPAAEDAPVVAFLPAHNEEHTIADVVARLPPTACGRPLVCLVVDDGSADASAERASASGARVIRHPRNLGLGAAVRRGLTEATVLEPAAVVYLDADGEYLPEEIDVLAGPILAGEADYVVGSRFAGDIHHMLARRRLGNRVLTAWVRWLARRRDITDGQSGYRAFSARAAADAEIVHDYNYAQVLTLDLLGKGYVYAEVPISYAFRQAGTSFIRLGRYLRLVVPAVYRELNSPCGPVPRN